MVHGSSFPVHQASRVANLVTGSHLVVQSDLTYPHTSVSGGFADKVRELDK